MECFKGIYKCMLFLVILVVGGCFGSPSGVRGELNLSLCFAEASMMNKALASEITQITIRIVRTTDGLSQEKTESFNGSGQVVTFTNLYPGIWEVDVSAFDVEESEIFEALQNAQVNPGATTQLQMNLKPTPGFLSISVDASQIPGYGTTVTKGTLYVYLDPTSGTSKSYTLSPDENFLKATVSIPEGTYQAKVAAPNVTDAVFLSQYYTVHIRAGKTTTLSIAPDGSINMVGMIDSTPTTPTGLAASYLNPPGTVELTWGSVADTDLAGYRIYRSNEEGRLVRITSVDSGILTYMDTVTSANFYNGRILYAISSYDLGGNESLWSNPVEVLQ